LFIPSFLGRQHRISKTLSILWAHLELCQFN
jgi:hypothetical protein